MLSVEDNAMITQVGPGTPVGELFRRFWLPALLSSELPEPDCEPVRLVLMGEELIVFRDSHGRIGCIDAYCPHRGAPLFFGRNELDGLRCIYHGWKFDVNGTCVDMPNCVEGSSYREKINIASYAAIEGGGLVWIYMGPPDKRPPDPGFEWFHNPSSWTYAAKYIYHSNYMQALEGDFDPSHGAYLHSTLDSNVSNPANKFTGTTSRPVGTSPELCHPSRILSTSTAVSATRVARRARWGGRRRWAAPELADAVLRPGWPRIGGHVSLEHQGACRR